MRQLDFIKIKVENVNTINTRYLQEHPTVKNRYIMNFPQNGFNGSTLFGNNIEVYHHDSNLYIKCSLPYLKYGHNYCSLDTSEARNLLLYISHLLGADLLNGKVMEYEVGELFHPNNSYDFMQHTITGVGRMKLQKKDHSIVVFGSSNLQFKFYDVTKNLRRKLTKEQFNTIDFHSDNVVKTELKFVRVKNCTVKQLLNSVLGESFMQLDDVIDHQIKTSGTINYSGEKFDDILYLALHRSNKFLADELVMEIIDNMDLTHSQRTARRKSLVEKQKLIEQTSQVTFRNQLENTISNLPDNKTKIQEVESKTELSCEDFPF